ncbi:hypothetical protein [Hymenobacter metallicola]|uniref:Uncharacterized protein n=1 Tax=Hymenobacter metallicola TaxID=2563114 RepID=A0A4Z0QJR4_9BACT|nr:hypothetical protein [Hymenobacter metallicola]TGE29756.1 hypothetical protein E5K02_09940 [Hymenobacter metallicola]
MKRTSQKQLLTDFATEAAALGARYGVNHIYTKHDPRSEGGPYSCFFRLLTDAMHQQAAGAYTPEDALENLEDALYQAHRDNKTFSAN